VFAERLRSGPIHRIGRYWLPFSAARQWIIWQAGKFRPTESLCLFAFLRPAQLDGAAAFDRHRILGSTNVRFANTDLPQMQTLNYCRPQ
jgi:hypothetical protein